MEPAISRDCAPQLCVQGPVATVTLHRPEKMNRITQADVSVLAGHCDAIDANPDIRVVVLTADTTGQTRPVFSAGYDVLGFDAPEHDPRAFERMVDRIEALRPVVLGALSGSVYGGATDLALACDLRVALKGTQFRMPACALGLHYYPSGLRRFVETLGLAGAQQAFLTAQPLPMETLQRWGAVMSVHSSEDWASEIRVLAQALAALAPLAVQATKQSLREIARGTHNPDALREREDLTASSADFAEGRRALAQRQKPHFTGR